MPRENKSKYALMAALSLHPMSGYDIKKTIRTSLSNFWSESYGQIYPVLKSLVADGLATLSVQEQSGKPDRHVYALTEAGHRELENWLSKPAEFDVGRIEILLKLFCGWQVPVEQNVRQVQHFRDLESHLFDKYVAIEKSLRKEESDHPGLPYWLASLSYGKHVCQSLIAWCDETIAALQSLETPPP